MYAYLKDGRRMTHAEYIKTSDWEDLRGIRYIIDGGKCAICKADLRGMPYNCHHLHYDTLGHENPETDVMTLCNRCHTKFHQTWGTLTGVTSQFCPEHWTYYDKDATVDFFRKYRKRDFVQGGDLNMCTLSVIRDCIDEYYTENDLIFPVTISPDDVKQFFVMERLALFISGCAPTHPMKISEEYYEDWLTRMFGLPGKPGAPNKRRSDAKKYFDKYQENPRKAYTYCNDSQYQYITNLWDEEVNKGGTTK